MLRVLAQQGPAAFYQGEIGERIVADMQAHGGFMDAADLAN
jgi:gamma-glutamyltranspeptidase/glutathione hydrolase